MMRPVLLTDVDNTMIYSYKRNIGTDKIEVEPYQGRIVSYMTRFSYDALKAMRDQVLFVPVTTRSLAQYRRISFGEGWMPEFALVSNGGTLLVDGVLDEEWKAESLRLIEPCLGQLEVAAQVMENDPHRTLDVRMVDDLFLFTKSEEPEKSLARLNLELDQAQVSIHQNGSKIYVLPNSLDKGAAADRLLARLAREGALGQVICAGDSIFDIPLLERGAVVFCPADLSGMIRSTGEIRAVEEGKILSDEVFRFLGR